MSASDRPPALSPRADPEIQARLQRTGLAARLAGLFDAHTPKAMAVTTKHDLFGSQPVVKLPDFTQAAPTDAALAAALRAARTPAR